MIQATFSYQGDLITSIEVVGHAGSGPYGYDIVCSAVTALVFATVNSMEALLDCQPIIDQADPDEGGYFYATLEQEALDDKQVQLLFNHLKQGLESIEEQYGEFIQVNNRA